MSAIAFQPRTSSETLSLKLRNRTAKTGVIGLGYVGCPLAVELASAGFDVTGIDLQQSKVDSINSGVSYLQDIPGVKVEELVARKMLRATTDFSVIRELDTISICVPTPLRKTKDPDL